jgi:hypothetical protein
MDQDPLQWLWDGINVFQTKLDDLRTRAMRNFERPFDVTRHDVDCGLNNSQTRMPCSCGKGALTFEEARHVKDKLTGGRVNPGPPQRARDFRGVQVTTCCGIENCREFFGLDNDKEALSAAFEAGSGDNNKNLLFGSSGIVSRTLDHWKDLLEDAFKLIDSLRTELFKSRTELFKSRAETEIALSEKEAAETERVYAKLKLTQAEAKLEEAQKSLDEMAKAQRENATRSAFSAAEGAFASQMMKKELASRLQSLYPGKSCMERLTAQKTPRRRTGLTLSLVVNRAARKVKATDSDGLHRSSSMRRRNITLRRLNEFVASAAPVHLPRVRCPPESDTKAHNDYKAKVCSCARARALVP